MLSEHPRPIFLTGHSLEGALASICALDLHLSGVLDKRKGVSATTYGSPKCGNTTWRDVYNRAIKSHWNVKIDTDVFTMLPKTQYCHVGKTALITSTGTILLDPSVLDTSFWSGELPSVNTHRKSAYKMALSVVSKKYLNLRAEELGFGTSPCRMLR